MASSYTTTQTFTATNAKYLASKVATDLKRIQRFYGQPSDLWIGYYETELAALLVGGYLQEVTYGFQRNGQWVEPSVTYTSLQLAGGLDDNPGAVRPNSDVAGAGFTSFLSYNWAWAALTISQQEAFYSALPFKRGTGVTPGVDGYLESDKTYSSGGTSLSRKSVRKFR